MVHDLFERMRGTVEAQSFDSAERTALTELDQRIEQHLRDPLG